MNRTRKYTRKIYVFNRLGRPIRVKNFMKLMNIERLQVLNLYINKTTTRKHHNNGKKKH